MRDVFVHMTRFSLACIALLSIISCSGGVMIMSQNPDQSARETATLRNGAYVILEKCDGVDLGSRRSVVFSPGSHTIKVSFIPQFTGNKYVYSNTIASVTFEAEAGHLYVVDGNWSADRWTADIYDKSIGESIAHSQYLPLQADWENL